HRKDEVPIAAVGVVEQELLPRIDLTVDPALSPDDAEDLPGRSLERAPPVEREHARSPGALRAARDLGEHAERPVLGGRRRAAAVRADHVLDAAEASQRERTTARGALHGRCLRLLAERLAWPGRGLDGHG